MNNAELLYFGRLEAKIATAEGLFLEYGARLRSDATVAAALAELETRLDTLHAAMKGKGFHALCSACAAAEPGGCCDATIAEEAYGLLLLVNLLLGVRLERQSHLPACCTFMGVAGCTLRAKPLICWNYNCHHIYKTLPSPEVEGVKRLVGHALQQLVVTEDAIRSCFALNGPTTPVCPAA